MDVRGRLVELIQHEVVPYFAERIAEYLIANGVTVQEWIPVTKSDLIDRKEILDKLDKWMYAVKHNLHPGLTKPTILDTLAFVSEEIQGMKSISPEYGNVSGGGNDI